MLDVQNLDLFYGQSQILYGMSFDAPAGQITTVVGNNGVGKTSLLKAIAGRHPAAAGTVTVNGAPVALSSAFDAAKSGIAYVPQGREIFALMSVQENLETGFACLPKSEHRIPDYIFELFPVLKDMRTRRGGDLSGGQQQQLSIARALITRPRVLLLDEPTEGIQPSIIKDIARTLKEIRNLRDLTIVVSEQVLSFTMEIADRFLVIEKGKFVVEETRDKVDEATISRYLSV